METLWHAFLSEDIGLPMVSSLVTGILIGFEREVREKPAGLRTHALVCFASTVLMIAAARQAEWSVAFIGESQIVTDPTRMAHGVLTGIGFLCAGVIFREGVSIHGLTTAASLWTTASIGLLYGVGMYWLAVSGAVATLTVLVALRLVNWALPHPIGVRVEVTGLRGQGFDAGAFRALVAAAGGRQGAVTQALGEGGRLRFAARVDLADEAAIDRLAQTLAAAPGATGFHIQPEGDPAFGAPGPSAATAAPVAAP